jgi:hypothetical protein
VAGALLAQLVDGSLSVSLCGEPVVVAGCRVANAERAYLLLLSLDRLLLLHVAAGSVVLQVPQAAQAGRQLEEPLADSVRGALSATIASSAPPFLNSKTMKQSCSTLASSAR